MSNQRRRILNNSSSSASSYDVGNIVFCSYKTNRIISVHPNDFNEIPGPADPTDCPSSQDYNNDIYLPIGIIVVPTCHNVYGDGSCGVMSMNLMSYYTPIDGLNLGYKPNSSYSASKITNSIITSFGTRAAGLAIDAGDITVKNKLYLVGNTSKIFGSQLAYYDPSGLVSSSNIFITPYTDGVTNHYLCQENSEKNDGFFELPADAYGTDFDRYNHDTLLIYSDDKLESLSSQYGVNNWRDIDCYDISGDSSVINWNENNYLNYNYLWSAAVHNNSDYISIMAMCAEKYCTEGTTPGDWFIPGSGECTYFYCRLQKIYESLKKLHNVGKWGKFNDITTYLGMHCLGSISIGWDSKSLENLEKIDSLIGYPGFNSSVVNVYSGTNGIPAFQSSLGGYGASLTITPLYYRSSGASNYNQNMTASVRGHAFCKMKFNY